MRKVVLFLSLLVLVACGSPSPTPDPAGALSITIEGLPAGTDANIGITGPNTFTRNITGSTGLSNLAPGEYTITATDVRIGDDIYVPNPANQTVTVVANVTETAAIVYLRQLPGTGSLNIIITGLPEGVDADVTVTGPEDFTRDLISSATFADLTPGEYSITAGTVASGGDTYIPDPASQTVTVNANTSEATVNYLEQAPSVGSLTIAITGLPPEIDANVTVVGPNGYSQAVTSSTTLVNLAAGAYTVTAQDVTANGTAYQATPSSQTQTVTPGATADATVTYAAQPSGPDCIVSIPDAVLQDLIRLTLDKPGGDITCLEMEELTELFYNADDFRYTSNNFLKDSPAGAYPLQEDDEFSIRDLEGLQYAKNLQYLGLQNNTFGDISALTNLVNIVTIDLAYNHISDISPLSNLTNVTELYLENNRLKDVSPLVDNPGLGSGDAVYLAANCLDLTPASPFMNHLEALTDRGVEVLYEPQLDPSEAPCTD